MWNQVFLPAQDGMSSPLCVFNATKWQRSVGYFCRVTSGLAVDTVYSAAKEWKKKVGSPQIVQPSIPVENFSSSATNCKSFVQLHMTATDASLLPQLVFCQLSAPFPNSPQIFVSCMRVLFSVDQVFEAYQLQTSFCLLSSTSQIVSGFWTDGWCREGILCYACPLVAVEIG